MYTANHYASLKFGANLTDRGANRTPAKPRQSETNPVAHCLATRMVPEASYLRAKLKVGAPDDEYEREADRVADQVVRMPAPAAGPPPIQRRRTGFEEEMQRQPGQDEEEELIQTRRVPGSTPAVSPGAGTQITSLSGKGQSLPEPVRDYFEPRLGYDLSQVRIHAGAQAAESARAVNARAFTVGRDVVFAAGEYAPEAKEGRWLLAHELTHVAQQGKANAPGLQLQPAQPQPMGPIEQAQATGVGALRHAAAHVEYAIAERDKGEALPSDVAEALARFFPGTSVASLDDLLMRMELVADWLPNIRILKIPPIPPGDPHAAFHVQKMQLAPAWAFPPGLGDYIALYPDWYATPNLQATRLVHEAFHYSFGVLHGNSSWDNAFAYQGFVSVLAHLDTGPLLDQLFPR